MKKWLKIGVTGIWGLNLAWDLGVIFGAYQIGWLADFLKKVFFNFGLKAVIEKCVGCFLVYLFLRILFFDQKVLRDRKFFFCVWNLSTGSLQYTLLFSIRFFIFSDFLCSLNSNIFCLLKRISWLYVNPFCVFFLVSTAGTSLVASGFDK